MKVRRGESKGRFSSLLSAIPPNMHEGASIAGNLFTKSDLYAGAVIPSLSMTRVYRRKVGPKGQVVVAKELRKKHGIKEGGLVEQISTERGVVLLSVSRSSLLKELDEVAGKVGAAWPKGVSAVQAVRSDREKA